MKMHVRGVCFVLVLVLCSACGPLLAPSSSDGITRFVIEDDGTTPTVEGAAPLEARLMVRDIRSNGFIASHRIVFSLDSETRGYYQFANWVEPPPARITYLLQERLDRLRLFKSVTRSGSSALGDVQLNVDLNEFRHDAADAPGSATVEVRASVVDLRDRSVLCEKHFSSAVASAAYDVRSAVAALTTGTNQILDHLAHWTYHCVAGSGA